MAQDPFSELANITQTQSRIGRMRKKKSSSLPYILILLVLGSVVIFLWLVYRQHDLEEKQRVEEVMKHDQEVLKRNQAILTKIKENERKDGTNVVPAATLPSDAPPPLPPP